MPFAHARLASLARVEPVARCLLSADYASRSRLTVTSTAFGYHWKGSFSSPSTFTSIILARRHPSDPLDPQGTFGRRTSSIITRYITCVDTMFFIIARRCRCRYLHYSTRISTVSYSYVRLCSPVPYLPFDLGSSNFVPLLPPLPNHQFRPSSVVLRPHLTSSFCHFPSSSMTALSEDVV